ncbi:MAG: CPBP family intramembrane glutamic endopeptidase [Planctomycetota bacterium]|jgi:membrane protease YdiL (CAAX protease family)
MTQIGQSLQENRVAKAAEIAVVFLAAFMVIAVGIKMVGSDIFARQIVVWSANIIMIILVWTGLRLRGQTWAHFGLRFRFGGWRPLVRTVLLSVPVLVIAMIAFVAGEVMMTVMMRGAAPGAQQADMSSFEYLQGNLPMLLLSLAGVYIVSSFGEEVLYRGFLINRLAEIGAGTRAMWTVAVLVSAGVFGLIHFGWGVTGMVQTALMGLALAGAYLLTKRNLWVLILAHAYLDTLLLVQIYLRSPGGGG